MVLVTYLAATWPSHRWSHERVFSLFSWWAGSYIQWAQDHGFGVFVFNGNENSVLQTMPEGGTQRVFIRGSESPEDHALSVWDHYIRKAAAQQIAIVAHSYGGHVTGYLAEMRVGLRGDPFSIVHASTQSLS